MKLVTYSWQETRKILVPNECPTDDILSIEKYIRENIDINWNGDEDQAHTIVRKADNSNWEIVEVEENYDS